MHTVLFLPFHGFGHFNGLFGVARELQKSHNVVFASTGHFHNHVTSRGFHFRTLATYPFGIGLEGWIQQIRKSKNPLWHNIVDRWTDRLYHERKAELSKVLAELQPTHVLVDAQQATDVIVLKAIDEGLRVSVVSIPPPYLLIPGLPPMNSTAMPGDGDEGLKASLKGIKAKVWRQKKRYIGMDDRTMVARRLRRNKVQHLKDIYPSLITLAVKDVDQYVLTYKEFDFDHEYLKRFKYVGAYADPKSVEPLSGEFVQLINDMKSIGKRIVYCAFGTVPTEKNIKGFLERLDEAIKDLDCFVIVSSKVTVKSGPMMFVTDWVPQVAVLGVCDAFITHGGMNSVHDAIRAKVPMLVYPIDMMYDQNGNSSRVVYHKLGLRGEFDKDTPSDIRMKLKEILDNRNNFRSLDTSAYSIDNFIKMIAS